MDATTKGVSADPVKRSGLSASAGNRRSPVGDVVREEICVETGITPQISSTPFMSGISNKFLQMLFAVIPERFYRESSFSALDSRFRGNDSRGPCVKLLI